MMAPLPRLLVFALGLTVLLLVLNLVRKRQLQERYALLWLLAGVALTLAPVLIPWLDHLAYSMGFEYPPALLLLLAVVGLLLIIFQLSLTISRSQEQIKVLAQELGLLRSELAAMQQALRAASDDASVATPQEDPDRDEHFPQPAA